MSKTIRHTGGLILADEMGLGKTLQIIALLLMDPPKPSAPALIVCPTSLIANWVREFSRFASGLSVLVHRGPTRAGIYRGLTTTNIVITTYDTLVNDISIFTAFEWSWVVCDEAQAIKNPDSNRRNVLCSVMRRWSIAMTGTPVENSLLDLWSLTDFVIPGLLGTRRDFESDFPDDVESAKALSPITDPIILKRRVTDVAGDLPERLDIDIPLELGVELGEHYIAVRKETLANYPTAGALVATLQLQLICAHPWLRIKKISSDTEGDDAELLRGDAHPLITPKMERTLDLLQEAFFNGDKVIVFALFNRVGDLLKEAFQGFPTAFWGAINGKTPQEERQPIIDSFTEHNGPGCLILNPKAAGAGLNITAATVVIHFTPVWNPALEAQASARAHRRGQIRPVTVYRLFYKDTVEEVMIDRSLWKSELANESVPVSSRDIDDLKRALEISPL
jgi:SNF2 family DNA or RNA helicase